jgi:hypothetical protein
MGELLLNEYDKNYNNFLILEYMKNKKYIKLEYEHNTTWPIILKIISKTIGNILIKNKVWCMKFFPCRPFNFLNNLNEDVLVNDKPRGK